MGRFYLLASAVICLVLGQAVVMANCPSGVPNEIFCDDFDTYCDQSSGGHPYDSKCPTTGATRRDQRLKEVWLREPRAEDSTEMIVAEDRPRLTSSPFGGHYPCQGNAKLGTMTIRDWKHSPPSLGDPGQIRNLSWRIQQMYGADKTAMVGTDDQPLILEFMVDGGGSDKIDWANGYVEVTLDDGNETGRLDRANTEYIESPDCRSHCILPIDFDPMPIICAQGNPDPFAPPLPAACPNVWTNPPPIRRSIAVGMLAMLDTDPCHCGPTAHGPVNNHLVVFDGQKWWSLRSNNPMVSTGYITPRRDDPMPPPYADLSTPGNFDLNGGAPEPYKPGKSFNWVRLTIKTNTFDVQLTTQETSKLLVPDSNPAEYYQYHVTSIMTNIPRAYVDDGVASHRGSFNSLRIGVGQGCIVQGSPNDPWACGGSNTRPLRSRAPQAGALVFDDLYFHGGAPVTETGACCNADASCSEVLPEQCNGIYRGRNTFCNTLSRPCCPEIFGDMDGDGDQDLVDFAEMQRCLTQTGTLTTACKCFDFDSNDTVNVVDIEHFARCANGPNLPGNTTPECRGAGW